MPKAKPVVEPVIPTSLQEVHQHYTGDIANMWQDVRERGVIKLNPSFLCGTPRCRHGTIYAEEAPSSERFHQHFVFGLGLNWWDVDRPEAGFCDTGRCRRGWYSAHRAGETS